MPFLNDLSVETDSFSKYITVDGPIASQLQNFYSLVARPVLSKYKMTYIGVTNIHGNPVESFCNLCQNGESPGPNVGKASDGQTPIEVNISGQDKNGTFEVKHTICHGAMDVHQE